MLMSLSGTAPIEGALKMGQFEALKMLTDKQKAEEEVTHSRHYQNERDLGKERRRKEVQIERKRRKQILVPTV